MYSDRFSLYCLKWLYLIDVTIWLVTLRNILNLPHMLQTSNNTEELSPPEIPGALLQAHCPSNFALIKGRSVVLQYTRLATEIHPEFVSGDETFQPTTQSTIMRTDNKHCIITTDLGNIPTYSSIPDLLCHTHEKQKKSEIKFSFLS